jgi:hypothetical protein
MEKRNKLKNILLFLFLAVAVLNFTSAIEINLTSTGDIMQLRALKYEPYPVNPGEYFDFWVSAQYVGSPGIYGTRFELVPSYPFSLDPNESAVQDFGIADSPSILVHYKIRVDPNAIDGINPLTLNYNVGNIIYSQNFDIDVENSHTDFDAIIQQISGSTVSIALANIGKYAANSVIVKIPPQSSFTTTDNINGQIVGNLASGDYSVVSFSLVQISQRNLQRNNSASISTSFQSSAVNSSLLNFDIYYTDNIGERRVVNMELPLVLKGNSSASFSSGNFSGRRNQTSSWSAWYTILIIAAVIGIVLFVSLKKFPKQTKAFFSKIKTKFKRKKGSQEEGKIPDWVKNSTKEIKGKK